MRNAEGLHGPPEALGPQLSLATRGEDWASQGQPKGKAEIPVAHEVAGEKEVGDLWFPVPTSAQGGSWQILETE